MWQYAGVFKRPSSDYFWLLLCAGLLKALMYHCSHVPYEFNKTS